MDNAYPYLYEVANERSHPVGDAASITFGIDTEGNLAGDVGGTEQFRLLSEDGQWFVERVDDKTRLSVNQEAVDQRTSIRHMGVIQADQRSLVFVQQEDPQFSSSYTASMWLIGEMLQPDEEAEEVNLNQTVQIPTGAFHRVEKLQVALQLPGAIELPERSMLIGRDANRSDICLPDVRISRPHALIARSGKTATLTDLKSANGTFVDGQRIRRPTVIREGDRVQIGPYNLIFRNKALFPLSHDRNVQLVARNLVRRVPDRNQPGETKVILDDISLVIRPREFACILGPSGSGKTTLLSALAARVPADEGTVTLNGEDLYLHFEALKQNLAVVPQRDVLHDVLPLKRALWYTARLRLPGDMSRDDIQQRIDEMLSSVNLSQHEQTPIRRLSGGQIKRASWANEAICNPSLIFLDEVTSGLDEQTDAEMMQLFRDMAADGKTIICVTHSLSYVEQNCNLLIILAPGGVLAFVGSPAQALKYFKVPRLGDIYQRMSQHSPEAWKQRFRESKYFQQYIERRLPSDATQQPTKATSKFWEPRELLTLGKQLGLLVRRHAAIRWANKRSLVMMFGQSLFIALLLVWLFGNLDKLDALDAAKELAEMAAPGLTWGDLLPEDQQRFLDEAEEARRTDRSAKLLFLMSVSCLWFGCNNAAKEIVKERAIYDKERDVGLKVISYYGSKLILLGLLSLLQVTLLFGLVQHFTHLGGESAEQWRLLATSSLIGVAMGLAISALANTEDLAVTIVPIALLPQIILAGLIAPLLNYTREFSQLFISTYWGYQGLLRTLPEPLQDRLRTNDYLTLTQPWTDRDVTFVLVAHLIIFVLIALAALYWPDLREYRQLRRRIRAGENESTPQGS